MKRLLSILLCSALLVGLFPVAPAAASPVWPEGISIQAEGPSFKVCQRGGQCSGRACGGNHGEFCGIDECQGPVSGM